MKKFRKGLLNAIILIPLAACETLVPVTDEKVVPNRPILPKISDSDLACVSDENYEKLSLRDSGWRHHVEKLETIILN